MNTQHLSSGLIGRTSRYNRKIVFKGLALSCWPPQYAGDTHARKTCRSQHGMERAGVGGPSPKANLWGLYCSLTDHNLIPYPIIQGFKKDVANGCLAPLNGQAPLRSPSREGAWCGRKESMVLSSFSGIVRGPLCMPGLHSMKTVIFLPCRMQ